MLSFSKKWIEVAKVSEFDTDDRKQVELDEDTLVGIFKVDGEFFAVNSICSHQHVSLMNGAVDDHQVICPLHGARFDLRTGKNMCLPAVRPIASYPLKVENGAIFIQES